MARMTSGRLFQRRGAALQNACSPCVCSLQQVSVRGAVGWSVGNELVGRASVMQLESEGFETSTVAVFTRSVILSEASEDRSEQQCCGRVSLFLL